MTKQYHKYKLLAAVFIVCCLQLAGFELFAQKQVTPLPKDTISAGAHREAPKAKARRHHDAAINPQTGKMEEVHKVVKDSINKMKPILKIDSLPKPIIALVDSLDKINRNNIKTINEPIDLSAAVDSLPKAPEKPKKVFMPNANRATWLAVVFPGGGQIYNRKYWKLPIIYGGFAGCAYALNWNGKMYKDYSQAYRDITDNNPNTKSYEDLLPKNSNYSESQLTDLLKRRKDSFRRYRDISIFAFIGVYLISVIDAYVDAELSDFDISPDLSMRVEPTVINNQFQSNQKAVGVQCVLRF